MPNPENQDDNSDNRPGRNAPPSNPDRKPPTKPVGRDSDASPGDGEHPTRTPNRLEPQDSSRVSDSTRPGTSGASGQGPIRQLGQSKPKAPATDPTPGHRGSGTPSGGEVDHADDLDAPGAPPTGAGTLPRSGQSPGKPDSTEPRRAKETR